MSHSGGFPILQISLGGEDIPSPNMKGLTGLRLQQRLSQPTLCELYFRDPPGPLDFLDGVEPGQQLQVWIEGDPLELFSGDVTAVEYHYLPENRQEVYLRAYDPLHRLRKRQSVRCFDETSLVGLAANLCQGLGLTQLYYPDGLLSWPTFVQHHQSDLDLLVEAAGREGLYLVLRGNNLHLISMEGFSDPPISLTLNVDLFEAHLEINVDAASDQVVAWGWNSSKVELTAGQASTPRSGRRVSAKASVTAAGGLPQRCLVDQYAPTAQHAAALAQAELDRRTAGEVVFQGVAAGNPGLRPGQCITVSGVAGPVAGRHMLTSVTHLIDSAGYRTELNTTPPDITPPPRKDLATLGEVTDISDPQGCARVRVRLPTFNNIESGWLPVAVPGAGEGKGMLSMPCVGDTVLVLWVNDVPGLVLGGLYGQRKTPDYSVDHGRARIFTWSTPGNQRIHLNDEQQGGKIRLENDYGAYIELDRGHITVAGSDIDFIQI